MASPFKIPRRKQPAGSDSAHLHMQSPLSRLQSPAPQLKGYGDPPSRGGADRMHAGNSLGPTQRPLQAAAGGKTPCKPLFRDVVQTLLGLNSPNGGGASPAANQEAPSSRFSNRWRPRRASDRLLKPQATSQRLSPPQKKKSAAWSASSSSSSTRSVSVESLDTLAELRGDGHDGSLSSSTSNTWRTVQSNRDGTGEQISTGSPPESPLKQQKKKSLSSISGSDPTSEDDFLSPSRTRLSATKARPSSSVSTVKAASSKRMAPVQSQNGTPRLSSINGLMEDVRERQRERWREFRERKIRLDVLKPRKQKQKQKPTPTEPIVLSSEDEEDDGDEAARTPRSCRGTSETVFEPAHSLPPPSFLQLDFSSLHAGLMDADGNQKMTITENGITLPLKGEEEGEVTVVASQLRGYGVWDGGVAKGGSLLAAWEGPAPSLLFLWVTDAQANLLQRELSAIQTCSASGPPCSFLLVVLKEQLQELQAALLASILDMEEYKQGRSSSSGGLASPLDWADGLMLLHSCPPPLDQHLLRLLGHSAKSGQLRTSGLQQLPTRLVQYPVAPGKGRITITQEDMSCLEDGHYLNDVIIDFYLKFLFTEGVEDVSVSKRSHVFSSFFFKQLSRRRAAGEDGAPCVQDRYVRHQRVKTWTRHVDIFTKDFLFVPVNQEAHWFLVVVCFPGLEDVQYQDFQRRVGDGGSEPTPPPPDCSELGCRRTSVLKRPCVLVMDSLKLSYHEDVCRLIRDYLQVEWEVRRRTSRVFSVDTMRSSSCRVPQQDNSSDCGVYLLQYVETFLQNPVVHFDLPLRLDRWFPRQRVRQKRGEIRSLIMRLHFLSRQNKTH